jgi:hypothetical protein
MATHFLPFLSGVEYLEERFAVFALEPWHTIMILIKYFYFIFFFFHYSVDLLVSAISTEPPQPLD